MVLNTTKETVCVNQIIGERNEDIIVEGDMIVPDVKPDILNTLSNSGNVCIFKKETLDGKIRIDGSVNVYIMYIADSENGEVRSLNTILDFANTMEFDECKTGMSIDDNIFIKSIETTIINERKVGIKIILNSNVKVYSNENVEIINNVLDNPDLQTLENTVEINSLIGEGNTRVCAKDTLKIDGIDDLAEILKVNLKIINLETKVSYNKILAKSELEVRILYLTEDNRINSVTNKIPIMGFIDMENVTDSHICNTKYKLKNLIIKANSVEEHSIYVEAEIEVTCFVYEKKSLKIIQDLYCPNKALNFSKKCIETRAYKNSVKDLLILKEKGNIDNDSNLYDTDVKVNIFSKRIQNGSVYFEGELDITYIYSTANSEQVRTRNEKFPFNHSVLLNTLDEIIIESKADIQDTTAMVMPDNSIEFNINIEFRIITYKDESINIIDNIDLIDDAIIESSSMVIYYAKQGDGLWQIAKMFNSTVDEIIKVNDIDVPDKIDVGMQLFIPRYI